MYSRSFLRPSWTKLFVGACLISLSVLVIARSEPTSKVTWEVSRGAPLGFLGVSEYRGPCAPDHNYCIRRHFDAIRLIPLLMDGFVIYLAVCLIGSFTKILRQR